MHDSYRQVNTFFMKYEDLAVDYFADGDIHCRTMTHPGVEDVKTKLTESSERL